MTSTLSAHHLAKAYGGRPVVRDVSLEVSAGEIVGLLGPNGAGKTTCFYMIVGLVSADKGQILLDGQDLTSLAMHRRSKMGLGYLPQEASVFRKLTVEQNIQAILELRDDLDRAGREQQLEDLLDAVTWGPGAASTDSGRRFKKLAHDLAGSGGSYGFPEVSVLGRELELSFLAEGEPAALRPLIVRLRSALAEARGVIEHDGRRDRP